MRLVRYLAALGRLVSAAVVFLLIYVAVGGLLGFGADRSLSVKIRDAVAPSLLFSLLFFWLLFRFPRSRSR
jgi:uncharacterized BrkB/YihY/UPF0761 family membrane protein